mgnify:CR=1 FL=1
MISKATEDTITSLFRDELERLGVEAELIPSITTPVGIRKPDLLCRNGGTYPVEAKFTERDLLMAIAKVQNDYLKYHRVLGIKGGFAVLYPERLSQPMSAEAVRVLASKSRFKLVAMFPPEDARPFKVYEGLMPEVAEILAEHILAPPKYVEPSIDYIIKSLRDSAIYILNGLRHLSGSDLEGFFGGKDVFKNVLQYEEGTYPVEELRCAIAYLLVNQLLFYHVLSRLRPEFPEIDPDTINQPRDLERYFDRILDINYKLVFSYNVVSLIPPSFLEQVRTIISVISGLGPQKVGGDLLGTIFHDLIPFEVRKKVAAFYTNVLAAELLASLSIDSDDAKVADFAVGSGGLLVAAYRRKKALLKKPFTQEVHRRFVEEELLGIDVMPFAANVAACHLSLQSPRYFTDKVSMAVWDSTDLRPGKTIPSVADLKTRFTGQTFLDTFQSTKEGGKGVVSLKGRPEEITLGTYNVVIMNPPFTRQERIPKEYKDLLFTRFATKEGKKEHQDYLHGQLGYYGYFILLADRFLEDNGRMALVLPASVLRLRSCEGLRKLWAERYHVEYIVTTLHRSAFSESTRFREILLIARKSEPMDGERIVFTVLKRLPSDLSEAREMAERIRSSQKDWANDAMTAKVRDYSKLRGSTENWFKYISISNLGLMDLMEEVLKSDKLVFLSSLWKTFRSDLGHYKFKDFHGFILYDEARALKTIDNWVLDRVKKNSVVARHRKLDWLIEVPKGVLGRGLRRASHMKTMDVSKTSDYLVTSWFENLKDMARATLTDKEIDYFKETEIEKWIIKYEDRKSHVLFSRRFDLSAPGTSLLAFYSNKPIVGINLWSIRQVKGEQAKILVLWLNSTLSLLQTLINRAEARGAWMTVHDYMLGEMLVPAPEKLSKNDCKRLLKVFNVVKKIKFPGILEQLRSKHPYRRHIDKAWLEILGYEGDADELLDGLYESLANEIELLKRLMAERE